VIDAQTYAVLQSVIRRLSRSLLQYVRDAFPWITREEQATLGPLKKLIEEEGRAAADGIQFLLRHHLPLPYLGAYPEEFTDHNYISLSHILPILIDHQLHEIADLERDESRVVDPDARALIRKICDMKRRHVRTLEGLSRQPNATAPQPATVTG
jgi:rubrerythrin